MVILLRIAVCPGSFDPITNGHLDIIERASKIYDKVIVGVLDNKRKTPLFSSDERVDMIRCETTHLDNIEVSAFSGLLADYVNENGFDTYVRGLRTTADFENELQMAQMNARLFTGNTESVFLMTDPQYSFISSSLVKEVALFGGSVDGLVPEYVVSRIRSKLQEE